MKKTISILAAFVGLLLSGCVSVGYVSFERLESGDINFPEDVRRVGVVNNVLPPLEISKLNRNLMQFPELEGDGKIAADTLAHLLSSADYFEKVVICDSMLQASNDSYVPLSHQKVEALIKDLDVDVLFSLERIKVELSPMSAYPSWDKHGRGIKSVITPVLIAYIPGRETPWFAINDKDSLEYGRKGTLSFGRIQREASAFSAYMLMEHLLPSWKMVERYYYSSGSIELRDANVFVLEENWEGAYRLWKQMYDTKKGKKKMMAAFNLAVYFEAHDATEEADAYIGEALKLVKKGSYDEQMMMIYQLQLKSRIEQRKKLDMQMKRFE